jgi:hypothetical protein
VGQDAALEEGVELILDEERQFTAFAGLGLSGQAGRTLLYQTVQRGRLQAVALMVNRSAVRRSLGL